MTGNRHEYVSFGPRYSLVAVIRDACRLGMSAYPSLAHSVGGDGCPDHRRGQVRVFLAAALQMSCMLLWAGLPGCPAGPSCSLDKGQVSSAWLKGNPRAAACRYFEVRRNGKIYPPIMMMEPVTWGIPRAGQEVAHWSFFRPIVQAR